MFRALKRSRQMGLIGLNKRNIDYIFALNPRRLHPLVNDKLKTKLLAQEAGIPTPELYGTVAAFFDIKRFPKIVEGRDQFVIKPAEGAQGNGVLVIDGRVRGGYRTSGGRRLVQEDVDFQLSRIISGMYSLGGRVDKALIEYRVMFDPVFDHLAINGVPDIRVIVYRGVPTMAMLRLPTMESDGRANLHKGGIGVGIDIASGHTLQAMQHERIIYEHPDTGHLITGIEIPHWEMILNMSARSADITNLGYIGVDIVLDKDLGPLLLELNARPGLAVQVANKEGLGKRTALIEKHFSELDSMEARIAFSREHFAVPVPAPVLA